MRGGIAAIAVTLALPGCIQSPVPSPGGTPAEQLARLESRYADVRDLYFQIAVTGARGMTHNSRGVALAEMRGAHRALRTRLEEALGAVDGSRYGGEDRRALRVMRERLRASTGVEEVDISGVAPGAPAPADSHCRYDPVALGSGAGGDERLGARMLDCFTRAAQQIVTPFDTTDRLSVLVRLGVENDATSRRALFLSLAPVWHAVDGETVASSPFRTRRPLVAERWQRDGDPIAASARSLGIAPAAVESTLVQILRAWRDHTPGTPLEPWDWYYENAAAVRTLSPRLGREALRTVSDNFHRELGADPQTLGIHYDLEPRPGKSPAAFTEFARPARRRAGRYGDSEVWVFASYREGGFDNLVELLHETGHAVHLSAITTRPAFADWPDSDPFTEALGNLLAFEAYEPAWQQRYLGGSASAAASVRAKYAAIVLDAAWALLEVRLYRDATRDPNAEWTAITSEYLRIVPHPEWSWWAMRAQLVEEPGYMVNYALGAIVTAALRDRVRELRAPFSPPDRRMYEWLSGRLYRWGLERPAQTVVEDFLGRSLSVDALLADMRRLADR